MTKFFKIIFLFLMFHQAVTASQTHKAVCERLMVKVRNSLVIPGEDPSSPLNYLRDKYGPQAYQDLKISEFEDDVEKIYIALFDDELKLIYNWNWLIKKWDIDLESTAILKAYYSLIIFKDHPQLIAKKHDEIQTLKRLLQHYRFKNNLEERERADYYRTNLGILSVPEMASHLLISQKDVYREIAHLGFSIVQAFQGDFSKDESQAKEFVRHHLGIESRGVSWDRVLSWKGHLRAELEWLVILHEEGLHDDQIAQTINTMKLIVGKETERTEAGVSSQLRSLQGDRSNQNNKNSLEDVYIFPYGLVKKNGTLIVDSVLHMYLDQNLSLDEFAQILNIHQNSLKEFLKRHSFLVNVDAHSKRLADLKNNVEDLRHQSKVKTDQRLHQESRTNNQSEALEDRSKRRIEFNSWELERQQMHIASLVLRHVATFRELPSSNSKFWNSDSPIRLERVMGLGTYANLETRLHNGRGEALDFWIKQLHESKNEFSRNELDNIDFAFKKSKNAKRKNDQKESNRNKSVDELRVELFEAFISHILSGNPFPSKGHSFWSSSGASPVGYNQATGMQYYKVGRAYEERALSKNSDELFAAYADYVEKNQATIQENDLEVLMKDIEKREQSIALKKKRKEFDVLGALDKKKNLARVVFNYIIEHKSYPGKNNRHFWQFISPVGRDKALGLSKYKKGGPQSHLAIFESPTAAQQYFLNLLEKEFPHLKEHNLHTIVEEAG